MGIQPIFSPLCHFLCCDLGPPTCQKIFKVVGCHFLEVGLDLPPTCLEVEHKSCWHMKLTRNCTHSCLQDCKSIRNFHSDAVCFSSSRVPLDVSFPDRKNSGEFLIKRDVSGSVWVGHVSQFLRVTSVCRMGKMAHARILFAYLLTIFF